MGKINYKNKSSFLILYNGWYSTEPTGGGRTAIKLAEQFAKMDMPVIIIAPSNWIDYEPYKDFLKKTLFIELTSTPSKRRLLLYPFVMIIRLLQLISNINTLLLYLTVNDIKRVIIFTHHDIFNLIGGILLKRILAKRGVQSYLIFPYYHIYPSIIEGGLGGLSAHLSLKIAYRHVDYYYTESSLNKKLLNIIYNIDSEKVFVAGVGTDYNYINNICNEINHDSRYEFDGVYIGRIHPTKGVFDLVISWKIINNNYNAKLAIIGTGLPEFVKELNSMIKQYSLENNIKFFGYVEEKEKFKILCKSRCLIHPSYGECIPLVFMEAMSAGVPIITYVLPTYIDVKDYIIPVTTGDINELSNKIIEYCIKNNFKNKINKKLKIYAYHQGWYNMAKRLIEFVLSR